MAESHYSKNNLFSRRAFVLGGIKLFGFGLLLTRYFSLQISKHGKFDELSLKNHVRDIVIPSERGIIFDNKMNPVVRNKICYNVELNPAFINEIELINDRVYSLLKRNSRLDISDLLRKYRRYRTPIILCTDVGFEDLARLLFCIDLNDKIEIVGVVKRIYLKGADICHITGYVGKFGIGEVRGFSGEIVSSAYPGKAGIERYFDNYLTGLASIKRVEVDSLGRTVSCFNVQEGTKGNDIVMSINSDIQGIVYQELKKYNGASAVVLNMSGKVIAMSSVPGYDPNIFGSPLSLKEWERINNRKNVMINRTISSIYPPGSTFKIVTSLAILNYGIDPEECVYCAGFYQVNNQKFRCWNKNGHGYVNLHKAIAASCNVYFYHYGSKIGLDNMVKIARALGLGSKTNIELPSEKGAFLPNKDSMVRKMRYGDALNLSIGQGPVAVTPLQLAIMLSRVVSGNFVKPTILHERKSIDIPIVEIEKRHFEIVKRGMYSAINSEYGVGYMHRKTSNNQVYAGKTGSAQVVSKKNERKGRDYSHGLFIGFWPYIDPKYVISVVVEEGEWGSKSALPIARSIIGNIT